MYIPTYYFGDIPIEFWEFDVMFVLLVIVFVVAGRIKKARISAFPEYTYFLWGLWARVIGGLAFGAIYIFYYRGGDTIGYYASALAYNKLLFQDVSSFFYAYFGPVAQETLSVFTKETGEPAGYMFFNDQTRVVVKILVPFVTLGLQSYFITTVLVSILTYGGVWRLYRTFVSYFPKYKRNLAIAVLFMPSVFFWGSGILKDSFTLTGTCYFLVAVNDIIQKKGSLLKNGIILFISAWVVIAIKPYIFLVLLPGALVWFFYTKITSIKNALIRYAIIPFIYIFIIAGSYFLLTSLGDRLGKFSVDKALETAVVTQQDLKSEHYEGNAFDIGDFEPTVPGVLSKFPQATVAGLYRPFIWESRNVVMLMAGLENLFILFITIAVLITLRRKVILNLIYDHPILLCSLVFSILFAFMIGLTTANFGALVRFKVPLIPLYMSSIMVMLGKLQEHTPGRSRAKKFIR
jgi:hypothetical protein